MKVGDNLYCKKYFFHNCHFFPGDKFEIICIFNEYISLCTKLNRKISLNINNNKKEYFNKNHYLWDYLQTEQEYRKSKLIKLNEIQSR